MPRLDYLLAQSAPPRRRPGARILVMTAKNPGFTARQRQITLESLMDVKTVLAERKGVEAWWRVSKAVAAELNIENQLEQISSAELAGILARVDAVISTPSTAILEAMLLGRPVAALDYHNVPRFLLTAWTISARGQIQGVVSELLEPPAAKAAYQMNSLADSLECNGPAAGRVWQLMTKMVEVARGARHEGQPLGLPPDLLGRAGSFCSFDRPPLAVIYPGQAVFAEGETGNLQVRLARAENERNRLLAENEELRKRTQMGSWLKAGMRHLTLIK